MSNKGFLLLSYVEDAFVKGQKNCLVCFNDKVAKGNSDIIKCNKKFQHFIHLTKYGYPDEGTMRLFRDKAKNCQDFNCEENETWK